MARVRLDGAGAVLVIVLVAGAVYVVGACLLALFVGSFISKGSRS